jgi:hypothetical protein
MIMMIILLLLLLIIIIIIIVCLHVPGVVSASKNEDQDTPKGKDGRCVWQKTFHLQAPMSRSLGALTPQNPLDPISL